MENIVYIVHCVDTEGPLYESIEATFQRVENIFGIKIEPTLENLKKLQNKEINLNGLENSIKNLVDEKRIKTNETWNEIDDMLKELLDDNYRKKVVDSYGRGWVYNWFCLDHVGFTGYNPRRRDAGHHNIFDHYQRYYKNVVSDDLIQFHYHPVHFSGNYNNSATAYVNSNNIFEILARKIIDRMWFPAAYRPGFHTERPDSNWFLEQWIPFDYANQAVKGIDTDQPDLGRGRFGDWRRATIEWKIYHPSHDDYQIEGNCRRWIARCLNMEARLRKMNVDDVRDAFERASKGEKTLMSFTNHDFRNMIPEIDKIRNMIEKVSKEYPKVKFKYCNAIEAMRKMADLDVEKIDLNVEMKINENNGILKVSSNENIFGPQPFLAIKTVEGRYYWDNFDFQNRSQWTYTFDNETIELKCIDKIGIAANSNSGVTEVLVYDVNTNSMKKNILNV